MHDTGPGIAPSQRAAIFEEFRRGEGAAGQGLGIGLAIGASLAGLATIVGFMVLEPSLLSRHGAFDFLIDL